MTLTRTESFVRTVSMPFRMLRLKMSPTPLSDFVNTYDEVEHEDWYPEIWDEYDEELEIYDDEIEEMIGEDETE
jgi:hypothetical protein